MADSPAGSSDLRGGGGEFERLAPEQQRILAYASSIGSEFDFPLLVAAMGLGEESLAEQLEHLVHLGVLKERAGGDRFVFAAEEVRAQVYRSLTESRLRVLHRKIAESMEKMHPTPGPETVAELGRHFFLGKVPEKSRDYNLRAAETARANDDPESAAQYLERVRVDLEAARPTRPHELGQVDETLGELYYSVGNFAAADRFFTEALGLAGSDEPRIRARLLLAKAEIAREGLDIETATRQALEALKLFEMTGDALGRGQTYRLLGRVSFHRGAYREALDESMRALEAVGDRRDPRLLGQLSIDIGNAFALLGPEVRSDALHWYDKAIERLTQARDWVELSRAYHNLGVSVGELHPQDGLEYLERARESGDRAHDPRSVGRALLSGVELRLALGQLEEAARDNEQAGRLLERLADDLGLEQVEVNRGLIAEKQGQWEDAERAYEKAMEICRKFRLRADEAEVYFYLARLRFKTRDLDASRHAFRAAESLGLPELRPNLAAQFLELRHQLDEAGRTSPPDTNGGV
ncbi:MAG TPA: tetratricopeptide repeat protein [Thermoplasmata archaeon]|nr:tetratricopeptide repeat protein [Thermoplasmata archaeon]